jgi:SagB-type dehydrogenase family enzyme
MTKGTGKEFMEKTKYLHLGESDQRKGLPQPPLELPHDRGGAAIALPKPSTTDVGSYDLREALEGRRSLRAYSPEALTLEELSWLLWATQGVQTKGPSAMLRTVPSAGARHAFETYILVNRVESLEQGLYRFMASEHRLRIIDLEPGLDDKVTAASLRQATVKNSAATFIWVAVPYRMNWRYDERGYRYLHLDVGHVCQNLYLASEAIGCGVCAIGAYDDDAVNTLLGLDGVDQFVIYMAPVGKKG